MATTFKLGRFTHLLGRAPDDVFPLADKAEEAINNALKVTSRATFVRAQKGTKRPYDDATIKSGFVAKHWLNVLDQTGHELGRVTHSDFEILKGKMKNKSVVVVVPVPSDDEPGEPMNQYIRLKGLMSAYRYPFHVEQEGQSFFQVPMKMKANNIGLLNGDATLEIKVNTETPAQQILLSYEDIVYGNVFLFGARNDVSSEKNFHQTFKTMEFFNICRCVERMASEFEYDSHQLAQLQHFFLFKQVTTYRKVIEEMRKTVAAQDDTNKRLNQMLSDTASQLQEIKLKSTLCLDQDSDLYYEWESLTDHLNDKVDRIYYDSLKNSFSGFQRHNKRLVNPHHAEADIAEEIATQFPRLWSMIKQSIRTQESKSNKKLAVLDTVFRMARQRNSRTLTSWAAINTIYLLAQGQNKDQIRPRVKTGECLSVDSTYSKLSDFAKEYHELIKTINQKYPTNVGSVDNFTKSFHSKNIRGAEGVKFFEATVRYTTRPRFPEVRVGSIFQKFELVDQKLQLSFVKVVEIISQDVNQCSIICEHDSVEREAVNLPLPNWKIYSITGKEDIEKPEIPSYTVDDIRAPLCLPNFTGRHQSEYLFEHPLDLHERTATTAYSPKMYMNDLRRTKILADFRRYGKNIDDPADFTFDSSEDENTDVRIYDETDSYQIPLEDHVQQPPPALLTAASTTDIEPLDASKTVSVAHIFSTPGVRKQLLMAKQFQRRVTERMDPWLDLTADFLFMTMSQFKETESKEAILMSQEFLIDIGLLKDEDGAISYADEFASIRRVIFGGDGLTNRNVAAVVDWLMHRRNDSRHESHAKCLQDAIQQFTFDIGHFHGHLHTLVLIFALNYGGLIQPAQAQIGWKRSTKDPAISYYQSCEIARIVYVVIKRGLLVEFNRMMKDRGTNQIPLKDEDKHSKDNHLVECSNTEEGWFSLHPRTILLLSARLFEEYLDDLRNKAAEIKDEGLLLILNYREAMNDHTLYVESVRLGDFLTPEYTLAEWLGAFVEGGKTMYTSSVLLMLDVISRSSDAELEELRLNRFLRVSEGKGCVALDELDEMINFLVKSLHLTDDVNSSLQKTAFLSTFKQVKNHMETRDGPHKNSVVPSLKEEYQAVYELFVRAELFKLKPNRKMEQDTLWDVVDESGLENILINKKSRNEITEKEKDDSTSRLQNMLNRNQNQSSDESCQWQDIEKEAAAVGCDDDENESNDRSSAITSQVREKAARILSQACDTKRRCAANFGPMLTKGGLKGRTPEGVLSDKIQKSIKKHKQSLEKRKGGLELANHISAEYKKSVGLSYDVDQQRVFNQDNPDHEASEMAKQIRNNPR